MTTRKRGQTPFASLTLCATVANNSAHDKFAFLCVCCNWPKHVKGSDPFTLFTIIITGGSVHPCGGATPERLQYRSR